MQQYIKKTFICTLTALALLLSSCGLGGAKSGTEDRGEEEISELRPVSIEEQIMNCVDEELEGYVPGVFSMEKNQYQGMEVPGGFPIIRLYGGVKMQYGRVYQEMADCYEHHVKMILGNGEDCSAEEICLEGLPDDYLVEDLQVYGDGIGVLVYPFLASGSQEAGDTGGAETEFWLFDRTGMLLYRGKTADILGAESKKVGTAGLLMADGGHPWIFDYSTGKLTELLPDGSKSRTVQSPVKYIDEIIVSEDGLLFVAADGEEDLVFLRTDAEGKEVQRAVMRFPGLVAAYGGGSHELLLMNDTSLYGISGDFQTAEEVMTFTSYGIDYTRIAGIVEDAEGSLTVLTSELTGGTSGELDEYILTPYCAENNSERDTTITIACLQSTELLRYAVNMFNEADTGVRAELKVYYDRMQADASPEDVLQKLNSDILDGTAGDIVCFAGLEEVASRRQYAESGAFADLNEWMDADEDFHKEDYFTSIWKANEIDGRLINMVPLFSINTMITSEEQRGNIPYLEDLVENEPGKMQAVFGTGYLRSDFIHDLCLYVLDTPEDTASLLYEPDMLAKYLEAVRELPEEDPSDGNDDNVNIHIGRELLYPTYGSDMGSMGRFLTDLRVASAFFEKEDYDESEYNINNQEQMRELYSTWGTKVCFTGVPIKGGDGSAVRNLISFGILENSGKKDAAWRFLKYTLDEEYQIGNKIYQYFSVPVNKEVFNSILGQIEEDDSIDPLYYVGVGAGTTDEGISISAPAPFLSQWMLEETERLINSITHVDETDPEIEMIVREETERFLSGNLSSYEAAERIGERVKLYMAE